MGENTKNYERKHQLIKNNVSHVSYLFKSSNGHFLGNWHKVSIIKLEVAASREATVALFYT